MQSILVRTVCSLLCIGLLMSTVSCRPAPKPLTQEDIERLAADFADHLAAGEYAKAEEMMNGQMKASMSSSALAELWDQLTTQLGDYASSPAKKYQEEGGYRVVYVTLAFADAEIDMKVVFDDAGKVAGLWFGEPRPLGAGTYRPPEYADQESFTETECTVGSGEWQLPATLTVPVGSGPFPAVVLVHGSGPKDRDETVGPNKPFADLAWGLAGRGIAVLRYEKRTQHYQGQLTDVSGFTLDQETVDDAVAAVELLRVTEGVDAERIFVLGHSLGGMAAPRIASRLAREGSGAPAGLIMMAANARDYLDLVAEQVEYLAGLDGQVTDEEQQQIDLFRSQIARIRDGDLGPGEVLLGAGEAYWADILSYDQVETAGNLGLPLLFLQGERDYQVTMEDYALWRQAMEGRGDVTFASYPGLNHLFIAGEGQPRPGEYETAGNVAVEVVEDVASWVKGS